ncbi:DTX3L ligase, partial [Alcedo cyanopectus]|nr:DTX3L ligase [Ceyx cyanopectus]
AKAAAVMAEALLVRLCPAPDTGDRLMFKLHSYFQSGKRSGGGECEIWEGSEPGSYWVRFREERDKKNVESRTDHILEVGGRRLRILIQAAGGEPIQSPLTEGASPSYSSPPSPSPARREEWAAEGRGDKAREVITKKIFLTVSATLNASMFTEQERERITILCPNLKREGRPGVDGSEKLTGDFTDIEKVYHYLKDILAGSGPKHGVPHSESKNGLKDENGLNPEENNELTVPSGLYEYFSHACQEQIRALYKGFGVCIKSRDHHNGTTSICLISDKGPASVQEANEYFIRTFQKSVENLKQEKIALADKNTLTDTIVKLNARFSNLLAKEEGNHLLLRGPASDISAAKKFLAEQGENSRAEKSMKISSELYRHRSGIEVDASVFKLLETELNKDIEDIEDKFNTLVEKKDSSYGQKMLIMFRPRVRSSDMSSHAAESFINAFQSACAMVREVVIIPKLSEAQKKRVNMLLNGRQLGDLHASLRVRGDKLILSGLPKHLYSAEKHIVNLLSTEDSTCSKNRAPLSSDLSYLETTGASEKRYSGRQKQNLSPESQAKGKTEEENQDVCPICMERITNKEILSKCKHAFCKACIAQAMAYRQTCPVCNTVYGVMKGDQPEGTMKSSTVSTSLPGHPDCGTIVITYYMSGGLQTSNHPHPGRPYSSTTRTAYLPNNEEGQEILQLLRRAFNQKLIFTVGQSRTTGEEDVITWNDIHHKTCRSGGPTSFGYPDPDYLQRVRSELKAKGID